MSSVLSCTDILLFVVKKQIHSALIKYLTLESQTRIYSILRCYATDDHKVAQNCEVK